MIDNGSAALTRRRYAYLRLAGPMMSFGAARRNSVYRNDDIVTPPGGVPTGNARLPFRSTLTGLLGNALGYDRSERRRHQQLHERIRFAAALVRRGSIEEDFATAKLGHDDAGWTTRGRVEGRGGGPATYAGSHVMRRGYWANAVVAVTLRLLEGDGETMADIAIALERPERPLFLGRKAQLPAEPLYRGMVDGTDAFAALEQADFDIVPLIWDIGEGPADAPIISRNDRNWRSGVHAGEDRMHLRDQTPDIDHTADPAGYARAIAEAVHEEEL